MAGLQSPATIKIACRIHDTCLSDYWMGAGLSVGHVMDARFGRAESVGSQRARAPL